MATTFELGGLTVHRVLEWDAPLFPPLTFFPTLTQAVLDDNLPWLQPEYVDPATGLLALIVQSFVVRTRHHTILVDSCVGNHKDRPTHPFWHRMASDRYLAGLAAVGVAPDDIDYVMCTHLHVDHVGWNTTLDNGRFVPTFPRARYLFADRELAFWTERERTEPGRQPWITDSVLPIVAAGRELVVRSDHQLSDEVTLLPTPGHTIDHYAVRIGRPGQDAVLSGDLVHSPLQARYPELGMRADHDPAQGGRTRRALFGQLCDTPTLLCPTHFPGTSKGRLTRWGEGFRFNPV